MSSLAGAKHRKEEEEDAAKASRSRKNETVKKMRLAFPDVPRFSKEMIVNFNGQFIPHTLVFWGSEEPGSADDETDPKKALGWHTGLLVKSLVLVVTNYAGGKTTRTPLGLVSFDDGEIELLDADKLHYKLDSFEMDKCRFRVLAAACQLNTALANADNISMIDWMEIAEDEIVEAYQKLGLIGKKDKYTCEITSHDNTTTASRSISEILKDFHRQGREAISKTGVAPPGFKNGKPRSGFEGTQWGPKEKLLQAEEDALRPPLPMWRKGSASKPVVESTGEDGDGSAESTGEDGDGSASLAIEAPAAPALSEKVPAEPVLSAPAAPALSEKAPASPKPSLSEKVPAAPALPEKVPAEPVLSAPAAPALTALSAPAAPALTALTALTTLTTLTALSAPAAPSAAKVPASPCRAPKRTAGAVVAELT